MVISIITNASKDPGLVYTYKVRDFLTGRGVNAVIGEYISAADFWVVLGGDGTMLHVAQRAAVENIPLLGINLGNLGFLTDVDEHEGLQALEKLLAGAYKSEHRLMLEAEGRLALNEIFIGATGKLSNFAVYINGQHMDDIRADGIITTTPTGSTAYSLSAGGPILGPSGQMIGITPVCPHSLSARPWVISAEDIIQIETFSPAALTIDGEFIKEITGKITVRKSAYYTTIVKTAPAHFYATLRKKKIL
jgi:NAD+ kinase